MVEHAPVKRRVVGSSPTIPVAFGRMHELKPMMVTSWEHTNINFVNIYNVFVLANTESQAGMVEMADTSDLSSDSKEWWFKSLYQYCILNRYMNWNNVILGVSVVWLKSSSILVSNVGSIIRPHER